MRTRLIALCVLALAGCQNVTGTADPMYKRANAARYTAVRPWLETYASEHPILSQRVTDVLEAWRLEVEAQQRNTPATQPVR